MRPFYGAVISRSSRTWRNVLIVRADAIGDFVLFLPALHAIRHGMPSSKICLLVPREVEEVAREFARVDEVVTFDRKRYRRNLLYRLRIVRLLRRRRFDVALNPVLSRDPIGDELTLCSGAVERIGFDGDSNNIADHVKDLNNGFYSRLISPAPGLVLEVHRGWEFAKKLLELPIEKKDEALPTVSLSQGAITRAREFLTSHGIRLGASRIVILFPGASSPIKRWPAKRYAELADRIITTFDVQVIVCGGMSDRETEEEMLSYMTCTGIALSGTISLPQLAAVFSQCSLFIGNDSGPLHLAAASGISTLCVLGGGHFGRFYPYGSSRKHRAVYRTLPCYHCNWNCAFERPHCIDEVTLEEVWSVAKEMLGGSDACRGKSTSMLVGTIKQ
jgi:ADP-heptose:LPS heptosyltransferase